MRVLATALILSAAASGCFASEASGVVPVFVDACMGSRSAYETIDTLGKARGWSNFNIDNSGKQRATPLQSIKGRAWILKPSVAPEGPPEMSVVVTHVVDKSKPANGAIMEMCAVTLYNFRSDETVDLLQLSLDPTSPSHRQKNWRSATTQWMLSADPMDGISLFEQDLRSGSVTAVTRGRMLELGKQ